jgi:rod shape-determining protein MreD
MINSILRFGLALIVLVLAQLLIFNNIQFSGYVNPYVYILFILMLPYEIPSWLLLILAFATGLLMDLFSGSPGMHTSSTVFAGFIRPYVLRIISPKDGYEPASKLSMRVYGFRWFLAYSFSVIFFHHLLLFYLEVFRFADLFRTMSRVLLSSLFTFTFILLIEFYRSTK